MTCEWVEGNLSAYLDDALDSRVREDVEQHLASCAHCQALLEEYRRDERLLRALPTAHPDDRLRERIFSSPEYAAYARGSAAATPSNRLWRVLLPAAAIIALAVSGGLYVRTRMLTSPGAQTSPNSHTIGGPSSFTYPLAPGQRVIFQRDGALWSAPETPASAAATASAPQRLTPDNARVVAWSVAPATAGHGGRLVAWLDASGALHLVRADGLASKVVAQVTPSGESVPQAILASLAWSPDGARLAFASVDATGDLTLRTVTVAGPDTTNGLQISDPAAASGLSGAPVWSANGRALAWIESGSATQSVWALRNGSVTQVAVQADPSDSQAAVAQVGWLGNSVTWATQRDGQITGVFAATPGATSATRLTPAQARYSAAGLGPDGWLLAGQGGVWRITPAASAPTWVGSSSGQISRIIWSPDGAQAALLAADGASPTARLAVWSAQSGLTQLSTSAASGATPVWSADSQRLAYVDGGQAVIARLKGGQAASKVPAGAANGGASLAWSADGGALAISDARGVYLASRDGQSFTLITSHAASASALAWSTAG